jgi:hypothetical protein
VFLGFTQYFNSCNKTLEEQDVKRSLIVAINNKKFYILKGNGRIHGNRIQIEKKSLDM